MVEIHDLNGRKHLLNKSTILSIQEAGDSSKWHGINTIVHLSDGRTIEAVDNYSYLSEQLNSGGQLLNG